MKQEYIHFGMSSRDFREVIFRCFQERKDRHENKKEMASVGGSPFTDAGLRRVWNAS